MNRNLEGIKNAASAVPEIAACYLFGSSARQDAVVNDLDLLILVRPEADAEKAIRDLTLMAGEILGVVPDRLDILLFDLEEANPEVLYRAVTEGVLLKNELPGLLSDRIESLSHYLLEQEYLIAEAKRLAKVIVEEFSRYGQGTN